MSTPPTIPGYDVSAPLGTGSTATVWRARRRADALPVAVKVVRPVGGKVSAALSEASLLASVRHPHVVHLYDVLPLSEGTQDERAGAVVLITQLAAGGSLAQMLSRRHLLSPGELVTVLQPIAGALADLHQLGTVHGDVSTGNIVFREDGMPLLADLGTARIAGESPLQGVGTGAGDGMVAPEVVEGFAATRESDVYQLGALARLCLVGEPPGPGFDRPVLAEVAPALPELLIDLVDRCMAAQPEDRPDAEEVAVALSAVAPPEPVEVAPDADAAHGLTERLRQVAQEDEAVREAGRGQPGAHRPERVGERAGGRAGTDRAPWALTVGGAVVGLLVLAMLVGVGWPVLRGWLAASESGQVVQEAAAGAPTQAGAAGEGAGGEVVEEEGPGTAGPGAEDADPGRSGTDDADVEDLPDPQSAAEAGTTEGEGSDPDPSAETLQALVDARARAWEATDPELLTEAVAAGSPAREQDTGELERARAEGISYPAVRFVVQDAVVVRDDEDRMTLSAAVHRDALQAVGGDGWLLKTPARTDQVQVDLVRVDDRWLLWSWKPVER